MDKYFSKFSKIPYKFSNDKNGEYYLLTDITRSVRVKKELLKDIPFYQVYHVTDGETPDKIAEKLYGTPHLHWIILLVNDMENWVDEFPLSETDFKDYIIQKYGSLTAAQNTIHHYENLEGITVFYDPMMDTTDDNRNLLYFDVVGNSKLAPTPISVYTMEERANEARRRIKVLTQAQVSDILRQYKEIL